jgi:hypothetical protein
MKRLVTTAIAVSFFGASPCLADAKHDAFVKAEGLGTIIGMASACGFEIDQPSLEKYYADNKLDTLQLLSYISNLSELAANSSPSPSQCTLSRATAKKIGILVP